MPVPAPPACHGSLTPRKHSRIHRTPVRIPAIIWLLLAAVPSQGVPAGRDFADMSLEELSNIEVTSVSRRQERLADAPASIYVITREDIRRSGATSLPEALRLAPNLEVARANSSAYAISARGFNNSIGNKLLVLIDGRTVYTPLFSGVFWDAQDVLLEDIEQIEVISGPGGTLWGTNAVNGVINVTTRPARDTQGALATAGAGNTERGAAARYGAALGANGHLRFYGKFFDRDPTVRADGSSVADAWHKGQAGFRADWDAGVRTFTLQGDAYHADLDQAVPGKTKLSGVNLLGRWNQRLGDGSNLRLQAYYDRTERDQQGVFREELDIADLELQHALSALGAHAVVWGAGYRYANDRVQNSPGLAFLPAERHLSWWNIFAQDEIALSRSLALTLGARLENNDYTGGEVLPSARLAWKITRQRLVWGAVSRAVRSPSRLDREFFVPGTAPFLLNGGPDFKSEISNVAEIGYRAQASSALTYSVTGFHHTHDRLRSLEPTPSGAFVLDNKIEGSTYGFEGWAQYRLTERWRLTGGAVVLKQQLRLKPDSRDAGGLVSLANDPSHQWMIRSTFDPAPRHELDVALRHVGALPNPPVPAYTAVDARWGWHAQRNLEISLTLNNLLDARHPEFGTPLTRSEFERSIFLKLLWRQ
jgi:iron complex outermembrane receptor protein